MEVTIVNMEFGEGRVVSVMREDNCTVDIRLFDDQDQPTEKGQALTMNRWKNLVDAVDSIKDAIKDMRERKVNLLVCHTCILEKIKNSSNRIYKVVLLF